MTRTGFAVMIMTLCMVVFVCDAGAVELNYREKILDNGFRILVEEVPGPGIVSAGIWVAVGSVHEKEEEAGIAHFVEHMLLKGTENRPPGHIQEEVASLGGRINGATSFEYTYYFLTLPGHFWREGLDVLSDIVLHPSFDPQEFEREKEVVLREIDEREDSPGSRVSRMFFEGLFDYHPYGRPIIGYREVVKELSREDLMRFYNEHYHPENMLLVVTGDIEVEAVIESAIQWFDDVPAGQPPHFSPPSEPPLSGVRLVEEYADIRSVYWMLGFHGPSLRETGDAYALSMAAAILGGGRSSRLYRSIREEKGLVSSISASFLPLTDEGVAMVRVVASPENHEMAKSAVRKEIKTFLEEGPTEEEMKRARTMIASSLLFSMEGASGRRDQYGYFGVADNLGYLRGYLEGIQTVTIDEVTEISRKYLSSDDFLWAVLRPLEEVE